MHSVQHKHARGQIINLLRVALEDSVDPAIRQVAAISFKNAAKRDWEGEGVCAQESLLLSGTVGKPQVCEAGSLLLSRPSATTDPW